MPVYLFPGQGSQSVGMGQGLFEKFPDLTAKADQVLGYSIRGLCLGNTAHSLQNTAFTQPALYVVNALSYFNKLQENGRRPSYVAGHSLGEFNALLVANVFDFETGLRLVKKRGELMSQVKEGAMAAIIGLPIDVIRSILKQFGLNNVCIANHNSHTQVVISGKKDVIEKAQIACEQHDATARAIPLPVSGAFHSAFMSDAQNEFEIFLKDFKFCSPTIPVIANTTARPYLKMDIQQTITQQMSSPVRWVESIEFLFAQGKTEFEEVGPGMVLTNLLNRIKNGI